MEHQPIDVAGTKNEQLKMSQQKIFSKRYPFVF